MEYGWSRKDLGGCKNLVSIRSCELAADRLNPALRRVLFGQNSVFKKSELVANVLKSGRFHITIQISGFSCKSRKSTSSGSTCPHDKDVGGE